MSITEIFVNDGQLNWDAIGVISNIVLATALVVITCWYAKKVSEQTALAVKDRERNKILVEVQEVLTPTIHHLKKEIEAIQNNKILWSERGGVGEFGPGYGGNETIKRLFNASIKDVIHKDTDLERKFIFHDDFRKKLNDLYGKIKKEVITSEFEAGLQVLVNKFNESGEGVKLVDNFDEVKISIGYFIISKFTPERNTDSSMPLHDFWEDYRIELLKFRDTPQIKELDKEIESILSQLKELDEKLLEKIGKIREEYRVKYNFTKYEIDPKLREIEQW
jgi:hypothetical protein